jgi:cysteine desulfurase family protein (TIGR01976 family)
MSDSSTIMQLNDDQVKALRAQFPSLSRQVNDKPAVFLDGPAGTQVPQRVIDAISDYLTRHNANHGGVFATSLESDRLLEAAHEAAADFLGTRDSATIAFGANMTTLTLSLSRAIAKTWEPGDEIVLTRLEHDANFTPWVLSAEDAGVTVRYVDVDPMDCTLRLEDFQRLLNSRTRLVAVSCASNATGTINPIKQICQWANEVGAVSFLDAVHYAPHDLIDVRDWNCDFLICSAYKFFGPHVGILWGRSELLESLQPRKLRPAPNSPAGKWMSGTQNHEGISGVTAAIDYLASLAGNAQVLSRREQLENSFSAIGNHEQEIGKQLIEGLQQIDSLKIWGITEENQLQHRVPTVSVTHDSTTPQELSAELGQRGLFTWAGNHYALPFTESVGLEPNGTLRIGLLHYNTAAEVDRLLSQLTSIC